MFDESEEELLRKCVVFYSAIGAEKPPVKFEFDMIGTVSSQKIKRDLEPVLRRGERFELETARQKVKAYLVFVLKTTPDEENFWKAFAEGSYQPERVFKRDTELTNIVKHPMALWKCRDKAGDK